MLSCDSFLQSSPRRAARIKGASAASLLLLSGVSLLAFAPQARAQALPPVVNVCAGPSVSLPILTPVTSAIDTSFIGGIVNPLLGGLVGNINTNLTSVLSGQQLSVSVLDANGNLISAPSGNCAITVPNPNGITLGGGRIDGLGGTGPAALAGDISAIAIGNGSSTAAGSTGAVALGTGASAGTPGAIALGSGSVANRTNAAVELFSGTGLRTTLGVVSVGSVGNERQITNVAGGSQDTDAVNVRQLRGVGTSLATSLGGGANFSTTTGSFTAPSYVIGGTTYRDVGSALAAIQPGGGPFTSLVAQAGPGAPNTVGVATDGGAVSFTGTAGDRTLTGVAPGLVAAGSNQAVNGSQLFGTNQALRTTLSFLGGGGAFNQVTGTVTAPSFTVGGQVFTDVASAFASIQVGGGPAPAGLVQQATPTSPITIGAATGGTVVDIAGTAGNRVLTGVAPGSVAAGSTDAVNGGQLFTTNQRIDVLATNAVQYDIDPSTGLKGNTVTLAGGDPSAPVLLRNVGAGVRNSDGANVGQVRAAQQASMNYTDARVSQTLQESKNYTDQQISNALGNQQSAFNRLASDVREVRREARQAAAVGLAAASLRYDDRPGKFSVAAGGGAWRGEAGAAFGVGYTSPDGIARFNLSASTSSGEWGVGGGLSLSLN